MTVNNETSTLLTFDTEYSADCVEFCPVAPFQSFVSIGTYELIKDEPASSEDLNPITNRVGRIYLKALHCPDAEDKW